MGEKSNGGHVATGGSRAVRRVGKPADIGLGGQQPGTPSATQAGGGGLLGEVVDTASDHVEDIAFNAVDEVRDRRRDD
jgi:hypothetical protein